jgi:4a-hydroxytetrahydrobiopterin dehydratase
MTRLNEKKCEACEGHVQALNAEQIKNLLPQLSKDWKVEHQPDQLKRTISFKNYYHTMAFVNALAFVANRENHHPDLKVSYNQCEILWTTHAIGGLSLNDFICASKTDGLIEG